MTERPSPEAGQSVPSNQAFVLELDPKDVETRYERGGLTVDGDALVALGRALAASPAIPGTGEAALIVKPGPPAALAVIGTFRPEDRPRLEALSWQVDMALSRLRYVGRAEVDEACDRLARALRTRLPGSDVAAASFRAIPRGGLLVLGQLAYLLDLRPPQLDPTSDSGLTVYVDDCAISGRRTREILERERGRVAFAHLFSHPDLRAAVEAHDRVEACVAAGDLADHAPAHYGKDYDAWRRRWVDRRGKHLFWVGQPDHLGFPWNEPDVGVWNAERDREEPGWCVVPPEHCLKNRVRSRSTRLALQMQPAPSGPLRPVSKVVFGTLNGSVVLAVPGSTEALSLDGVAGDIWNSMVRLGELEPVVDDIASTYGTDPARVGEDVRGLMAELSELGVIEGHGSDG